LNIKLLCDFFIEIPELEYWKRNSGMAAIPAITKIFLSDIFPFGEINYVER